MEKVKITKEMLTDYIGRPSVEEMTVKDLLERLRFQPDGAGSTRSYDASLKKLEMLKKELDRYFSSPIPKMMPTDLRKQFESYVLALYLNPNRISLAAGYNKAKEIFSLRVKNYTYPSIGSIKRKLSSIPAEIVATARGE